VAEEGGLGDAVVDVLQERGVEVLPVVAAGVVLDPLLLRHLRLHVRVVEVGREHDDGVGEHECRLCIGKQCGTVWVCAAEPFSKTVYDPFDQF